MDLEMGANHEVTSRCVSGLNSVAMSIFDQSTTEALKLAADVLRESRCDLRGQIAIHTSTGPKAFTPDHLQTLCRAVLSSDKSSLSELARLHEKIARLEEENRRQRELHKEQLVALASSALQWRNRYDELDADMREHLICTE